MIGWTHRNDRRVPKPCPCGGVCSCHKPDKVSWQVYAAIMLGLFGMFITPIFFAWWSETHPPAKRYIEVGGQMCEIRYKETGRTSTGASIGHDEAICK